MEAESDMATAPGVVAGNAATDGIPYRGWLVGHFAGEPDSPTRTGVVEVKWGLHPTGDHRATAALNVRATTLSILVRGRFRLRFPDRVVVLEREGDYALWEPGVAHDWLAEEESVVMSVRWPSVPNDSRPPEEPGAKSQEGDRV